MLAMKPWLVTGLAEAGELRSIHYGSLTLVSAYDVEQLGGVLTTYACPSWCVTDHAAQLPGDEGSAL